MSPRPSSRRVRPTLVAVTAATGLVVAGAWLAVGTASAGSLTGSLYTDPGSQAARWVTANSGDSRAAAIRAKIASQPAAHWLSSFNLSTVQSEVSTYMAGAKAVNKTPVLSVYEIPNRDCGGYSAGGAKNFTEYQTWVSSFSKALGSQPVIIILETDSIALQCAGDDLAGRNNALTQATKTIKAADPNAKVYLDGGHSAWQKASEQASRLKAAGIEAADGFYTNVSNFRPTSAERTYGQQIIAELTKLDAKLAGKHQVIDTSRNGAGAPPTYCADSSTAPRLGAYPTLNTGDANIDGYLWIKPPGEADGCTYSAGSFQASLAASLATGVADPPAAAAITVPAETSAPATVPASSVPAESASQPAAPAASGGCTATFQATNTWGTGVQGQVVVAAGSSAVSSWNVTMAFASGQSISQIWNGTLTTDGSVATVRNVSWNGALGAGASASFGFVVGGGASAPSITCTAFQS